MTDLSTNSFDELMCACNAARIAERYKRNERLSAKEYLEKIVQLPFVMRGPA